MTTQELSASTKNRGAVDAAIDGLLAGIGAGLIMILVFLIAGVLSGDAPADVIGRFDPAGSANLLAGTLTHLAVSAIYGATFGLLLLGGVRLRPLLAQYGWLAGLLYGLALYVIAFGAIGAGVNSGLAHFPVAILLLVHIIYGFVLGLVIGRGWR